MPTEEQTATPEELAYDAGRAALSEPADRRGIDACPFSAIEHPEERAAWLRGLAEAAEEAQPDVDALRAEIAAAQNG